MISAIHMSSERLRTVKTVNLKFSKKTKIKAILIYIRRRERVNSKPGRTNSWTTRTRKLLEHENTQTTVPQGII